MSYRCREWGPLGDRTVGNALFGGWLAADPAVGPAGATAEVKAALAAADPDVLAPLWRVPAFAERLPARFRTLARGPAVVVTGQQPGFLGGPLLTLYKIATAVALARLRTEAGRPTVPVFWSGDDDDDLAEGFATVGWRTSGGGLFAAPGWPRRGPGPVRSRVMAEVGAAEWAAPALAGLPDLASGGAACRAAVAWLQAAVSTDLKWGPGQAGLVERLFAGTDLVVIRGDDPQLHAAGADFYALVLPRLTELADLARARGAELTAAGFHAQLGERSLARSIYLRRRQEREATAVLPAEGAGDLRPGVLLRSPLQDWLLQPAGVVVGPGELAYLRQLDPLYAALRIPRAALVPRLAAWVLPEGDAGKRLQDLVEQAAPVPAPDAVRQAAQLADGITGPLGESIRGRLCETVGTSPTRAAELAAGRVRRFRKGLIAMITAELADARQRRAGTVPGWLLPAGQRQERLFGILSAAALWGDPLVTASLAAASTHLAAGLAGQWRQWALEVPASSVPSERNQSK